jgi:diguanylate cyclase (GGDEF)-like protein
VAAPGALSPASSFFILRLRWIVASVAPVLLLLSPLPFDRVFYSCLGIFGAVTAYLHIRFVRGLGSRERDRLVWYGAFAVDLLLVTAVVYFRAGITADIYSLYLLAILQCAILYGMSEALLVSLGSAALYAGSIWLQTEDLTDLRRAVIRGIYMLLIGMTAAYLATNEKKAIILSLTDFKTNLPNFRHFHQALESAVIAHRRAGMPLTVAILDCDNFKQMNAQIGHTGADQVLEQLAELLTRHKRQSDMLARYGGEEFVMFLPGVGAGQALPVLERFRAIVADHKFQVDGLAEPVQLTISIGAAVLPDDAHSEKELLVWADAALNHAKQSGKNRCSLGSQRESEAV